VSEPFCAPHHVGCARSCSDAPSSACPEDPALAGTYDHIYGGAAPDFQTTAGEDVIKYGGPDGAIFRVEKKLDAPTIVSNFYIMWGHLDVTMKAAPGGGIVSSVVLQSDNLDEIDWEWVGSKPNEAQSNYFGKGNTDSYDRGAVHPITSQDDFHTYSLEWTQEKLDWIINGQVVRTLKPSDVKGDFYPQTPMQVRLGSWAAGDPDNEEGTIRKFCSFYSVLVLWQNLTIGRMVRWSHQLQGRSLRHVGQGNQGCRLFDRNRLPLLGQEWKLAIDSGYRR